MFIKKSHQKTKKQMDTFDEKIFWELYNQNLAKSTDVSREALSKMIALCPDPQNLKQLEKNRFKILAWKALRDQKCADNGKDEKYYPIKQGEIIIEDLNDYKETLILRVPLESFTHTGFPYGEGEFGSKGLFMPMYDIVSLEQETIKWIEAAKKTAIKFIKNQKETWFGE